MWKTTRPITKKRKADPNRPVRFSHRAVVADPTQVRVVNHKGESEVYIAEQLYAALEPIGSSGEVREILVNGGLEL